MRKKQTVPEETLQDRPLDLAAILESVTDAVISTDAAQRIVLFNRAAEEIFRCPAAEALGETLQRFIPEGCSDLFRHSISGGAGTRGRPLDAAGSLSGLRANGEAFPIEAWLSSVMVNGEPLYTITLRDFSERKRTEEMLRKLSGAIEQTADSIFITDREGVIEYVNPAFEAVTGFPREMATGQTPRFLKSGEHEPAFYERLWRTILAGRIFRGVFVNRKRSGELYFEEKTITPLKDEAGHICYFISTGRDITERVQAFQLLERRVAERTQETEKLYAQAEQRRRELEALYRADEDLYRHLRLDQVLQALVDVVIDILHADKASVQIWDAQQQRLIVRAARGYRQEMIDLMSTYRPGDGIAGNVFLTGEPIAVEDARFAPPPADHIAQVEGIYSVLSVPLVSGNQVYGIFAMDYCQPRSFTADDRRLFLALAQRAAMAIENARLYEQAEQMAVLEERQRLARELHDSVTQSLYSMVLLAEAGRRFAEGGDWQHSSEIMARLGETGQQALREMRLLVYEMRPLALQETGLVGALQHRLDAVERRAGIHATLELEGELPRSGPWEEAMYRIAQEALNNALKHAAATTISVSLRAHSGDDSRTTVEMVVADNGRGFELHDSGHGIGLSTMAERAARLGASITIDSVPDRGTVVTVAVVVGETLDEESPMVATTLAKEAE